MPKYWKAEDNPMRQWSVIAIALLLLPSGINALVSQPPVEEPDAWIWSPETLDADLEQVEQVLSNLGLHFYIYENIEMASFIGTSITAALVTDELGGDVERNQMYDLDLDRSVLAIEADAVANAVGNQRQGPSVMVIDTGIDSNHPDFQDGNVAGIYGSQRLGGLVTGSEPQSNQADTAGHGTHVTGIVAGSAASLGSQDYLADRFKGVYANGRIISYQALAQGSGGDSAQVDTMAALEGIDLALSREMKPYNVKVIQASWGTGGDLDPKSAVVKATLDAYLEGVNVIFSAGNRAREINSLNSFCQVPWVLCVANVDNDGELDPTSSVGTANGITRPYAHPDIAAPGQLITATSSTTKDRNTESFGVDQAQDPNGFFGKRPSEELYELRTGTSMSAPHVSGVAALLIAANPRLSPDQVMDIIVETARPLTHQATEVGAGMINAREAYNLAIGTTGNRAEFISGDQVKYGGPATGDPTYTKDSMSVGYDSTYTGSAVSLSPSDQLPNELDAGIQALADGFGIEKSIVFWSIAGLFVAVLLMFVIRIATGRRRRYERKAVKAAVQAAKAEARADRLAARASR
jgi:serine protease AprX